ncbi:MAG TPA: GDP-mannose 4,6-dehydratase [Nocardioides sp.]|nr:GDP-mannose 4,6-dehydratase [Nocardioides sp.]
MTHPRTALITGVSGQDGIYLARALLADGLRVVGTVSPSGDGGARTRLYAPGTELVTLDIRDAAALGELVAGVRPDEIYHLAAFSSVGGSWVQPELAFACNTAPVGTLLEAVVALGREGHAVRMFQASSAETLGGKSPYAESKRRAAELVAEARREHGVLASVGTLFNHESPLRGEQFVTRKITRAAAAIALGLADSVTLGSLDVSRDWGHAGDYVGAMRASLAHDEPVDVQIGTGVAHTLGELVETAFAAAGLADAASYVVHDPALVRPADVAVSVADPRPAAQELGWTAAVTFEQLVQQMVDVDLLRAKTGVEDDPAYLDLGFVRT